MTYSVYSGLLLRLIDFDTQPWTDDTHANFRAIGDWYDSMAALPTEVNSNYLMNAGFNIWQRGVTFTPTHGVMISTADRWRYFMDGSGSTTTITKQSSTTIAELNDVGCVNYLKHDVTVAGTGETTRQLSQRIESVATLSGGNVTVSFVAWGTAGKTIQPTLSQRFGSGGSPSANVNFVGTQITLTATPTRYTQTFSIDAIDGKTIGTNNNDALALYFNLPLNTIATVNIGAVTVNRGSSAYTFRPLHPALDLQECMRYYEHGYNTDSATRSFATADGTVQSFSHSVAEAFIPIDFKVKKRNAPTFTIYDHAGTATKVTYYDGVYNAAGTVDAQFAYSNRGYVRHTIAGSYLTLLGWTADAEDYT